MAKQLDLASLQDAVRGHAAAIRCRSRLQPAGGEGTKVFPPTHAGGVYATEKRRMPVKDDSDKTIGTREADCVLLDSVQSQANRMEDALQQAIDEGLITMPLIEVDFRDIEGIADIQKVTSLQAPHRAADAILRDSLLDGSAFRASTAGKSITDSGLANATGLYQYCPHALFLGVWDSTGPKGGLGAKFARALVSEIVGIDVTYGVRTGSRIDPLQIRAGAKVIKSKEGWQLAADENAKGAVSPSETNHGNIPPTFVKYSKGAEGIDPLTGGEAKQGEIAAGGATLDHAEHTAVLSLPQLRRLRFPLNGQLHDDPKKQAEIDAAARTVLASLALVGLTLSLERGADLRSRCLLVLDDSIELELLDVKAGKPDVVSLTLDSAQAIGIYNEAVKKAEKLGLPWQVDPIVLKPSPELIALVAKSQQIAAADVEGD